MRFCKECNLEKSLDQFYARSAMCKKCHNSYTRAHYVANKPYYKEKARKNNMAVRDRVRAAKEKPCSDCGISYPYYVMDFDHLGDKEFNISQMATRVGWTAVELEIAKCDVVCSNCHRERTHRRHASVA